MIVPKACFWCEGNQAKLHWRQSPKDWKKWTLFLKCTSCGKLQQASKKFSQLQPPKPDVANQKSMFA